MTGLDAESVLESDAVPEQHDVTSVCAPAPIPPPPPRVEVPDDVPESPEVVLSEGEFNIIVMALPGLGSPPPPTPTPTPANSYWLML